MTESPTESPGPTQNESAFEYDYIKSASNKQKHGIDFEEAQVLWKDTNRTKTPSEFIGESRIMTTAKYHEKLYTAIYTERNGAIRIISVRRARSNEVRLYEHKDN
ncbi:MAG: BrnT family toxin [Coriobacteriales bacterium]|jgi:uncharacterized DUF497 family protein|nr:BrnT family toxin [Coriobacteriales bacterium]